MSKQHGDAQVESAEDQFDKLMNHEYDGIREYDNPLPSWWVGIFLICIAFAAVYWIYYHGGGSGLSEQQVYAQELAAYNKQQEDILAKSIKVDLPTLAKLATNGGEMAKIKGTFVKLCSPCHKPDGSGLIGPNMTDDYQLHGTTRLDIYKTIRDGVPAKGMQSWKMQLNPLDMARMAAYVSTLRGTKVAKPKPPQGKKIPPYQ